MSGERLPEHQYVLDFNETKDNRAGSDRPKERDANENQRDAKGTRTSPIGSKSESDNDGEAGRDEFTAKGHRDSCAYEHEGSIVAKQPSLHLSTTPSPKDTPHNVEETKV